MTRRLIILGTGGNCVDILDAVRELNAVRGKPQYECVAFLDDDDSKWGQVIHGVPVRGPLVSARTYQDAVFVNGIGSARNHARKPEIVGSCGLPRERFVTIVHPSAQVSALATLGAGCVILQGSVVASGARLGDHVMVLPLSIVSHDAEIGEHTVVAGGVCINGMVRVGRACYLGSGCQIKERVRIGDFALCGMGAVVLRDVPERAVVAGNPARMLRRGG